MIKSNFDKKSTRILANRIYTGMLIKPMLRKVILITNF